MNFVRRHGRHPARAKPDSRHGANAHRIVVAPGGVHESVHYMHYEGELDMSELEFYADPFPDEKLVDGIQSWMDVVVVPVPEQCSSDGCDLSKYGIGKSKNSQGTPPFVDLCDKGRFVVNNRFEGVHTQLMVPRSSSVPMPDHLKKKKISLPRRDQTYNILFANCNPGGRNVHITGQVILEYNNTNSAVLTFQSVMILVTIAFSICSLLTVLSVRVHRGTRSDFEYEQISTEER